MHYAFRWLRAVALAVFLSWLYCQLIGSLEPPELPEPSDAASGVRMPIEALRFGTICLALLIGAEYFPINIPENRWTIFPLIPVVGVVIISAIGLGVVGAINHLTPAWEKTRALLEYAEQENVEITPAIAWLIAKPFRAYIGYMFWTAFVPVGILIGLPWLEATRTRLIEHPDFRAWFVFGRGGSARWAGLASFEKNDVSVSTARAIMPFEREKDERGLTSPHVYLGRTFLQDDVLPRDVGLKDEGHLLTIGGTAAGKSTTAIGPNLAMYEGVIIAVDPKGEHASRFIGRRQSPDYKSSWDRKACPGVDTAGRTAVTKHFQNSRCFLLDPFKQVKRYQGHCYNPLDDIDINDPNVRGELSAISDGCAIPEGADATHFVESTKIVIEGLLAHVKSACAPEQQNLPYVADILQGLDPELRIADPQKLEDLLIEMRTNEAAGGLPMMAANVLDSAGDRERGSILTTCYRSLKWATDPAQRRQLSRSDFRFDEVTAENGNFLSIVLPFEFMKASEQVRWMRVQINLFIAKIERRQQARKPPILFILDEFARLGTLKPIEDGIVTLRSAGVKLWLALQDLGQLKHLYKANWETFLNASNVQVFGVSDLQTATWISDRLGQAVWRYKEGNGKDRVNRSERRPLMTPDEVMSFLGVDEPNQIVFPRTGYPMRLRRMSYVAYGKFAALPLEGHYDEN